MCDVRKYEKIYEDIQKLQFKLNVFRQSGEIEVVNRPHHLHCQPSHRRPLRFHPIR